MVHIAHANPTADDEPVAILWGDNYLEHVSNFRAILKGAEKLLHGSSSRIFFIGETPRFANDNLGWLGLGQQITHDGNIPAYGFESLT